MTKHITLAVDEDLYTQIKNVGLKHNTTVGVTTRAMVRVVLANETDTPALEEELKKEKILRKKVRQQTGRAAMQKRWNTVAD